MRDAIRRRDSRRPHARRAECAKKFPCAKVSGRLRAARDAKFRAPARPRARLHASRERRAPRNRTARPSRAPPAIPAGANPPGISRRMASWMGATFSHRSLLRDHVQQISVALERRPRRERHERGQQRHAQFPEARDDREKIGARVALVEFFEHRVIHRFHGADDEQASGIAQRRQDARRACASARS